MLAKEPIRRSSLLEKANYFRSLLKENSLNVIGNAQIAPVLVGENYAVLTIAKSLYENGIFALAVRPHSVPAGKARIRFSITCNHSEDDFKKAADVLKHAFKQISISK